MGLFKEIFSWWSGNSWGTRFTLWKAHAERVGQDELGNIYYRAKEGYKGQGERRWVIYPDLSEASNVPPLWHGWLHHQSDAPPAEIDIMRKDWQRPHQPNMTGTAQAYRPPGSALGKAQRLPSTGDYEAWTPK